MKIKLVAFDLDGTVFARPGLPKVSERVEAAFSVAASQGAVLAACSGRPTRMLNDSLATAPWLSWAISASGARVAPFGGAAGAYEELHRCVPHEDAVALARTVEGLGGTTMIHCIDETLAEQRLIDSYIAAIPAKGKERGNFGRGFVSVLSMVDSVRRELEQGRGGAVEKIDCHMFGAERGDALAAELGKLGCFEVARVTPDVFEVTVAGATKGTGLDWLCGQLGIDPADSVAFGDSANDLTLVGHAGTFVAMGNATDEVKAAASDICESADDDGVARWLERQI